MEGRKTMNPVKINTAAMPRIEIKLLCSTFLEQIKAFYQDPENVAAFEAWKKQRENGEEKQV